MKEPYIFGNPDVLDMACSGISAKEIAYIVQIDRTRKPGTGWQTKLTGRVLVRMIEGKKAGLFIDEMCHFAGISTTTYHRWHRVAKVATDKLAEGKKLTVRERALSELFITMRHVEAGVEYEVLDNMRSSAKTDWHAGATYLKLTRPDRYATRKTEVSGKDGKPISFSMIDQALQEDS